MAVCGAKENTYPPKAHECDYKGTVFVDVTSLANPHKIHPSSARQVLDFWEAKDSSS